MRLQYPRRLFTKMLVAFLFVFLIISQVIWLGFSLVKDNNSPFARHLRSLQQIQLSSISAVLQHAGPSAAIDLVNHWEDAVRPRLRILSNDMQLNLISDTDSATQRPPIRLYHHVVSDDGKRYLIELDYRAINNSEGRHGEHATWHDALHIPTPMLIFAPCLGMFFSLLLAWNMTRPIRQLRAGFAQISRGDLTVRLYPTMRRRYDELSLVAKDFDAMVERLDVLVKAREALLHDISHELRTPLARVQLAIGLARQNAKNIPQSLERIEQEAERLDKMIGELLTLSRTEHQGIDNDHYVDFLALLEAVIEDVRYEAQQSQVVVELHHDGEQNYTFRGNAELIRRAVENVLRNALRYSLSKQTISVRLCVERDRLLLTIADQGPGVDDDKLSSMFDPFVRLQSSQTGKGYGLGLAIVRKVILAHYGQVIARNRPAGGLEIAIELPRWVA